MKTTKKIFLFILPVAYISYILYIRLFLVRTPRILCIELSNTQITFTVIIILGLLLRIYVLLKKLDVIKDTVNYNNLIVWLLAKISIIVNSITALWMEFYHQFTRSSLKFNLLILGLAQKLRKHLDLKYGISIIVLFEILPKLIVVTAFVIDVFIFQQFFYFYKVLFLVLLPLTYGTLRSILLQFYEDNYENLRSFLDIKSVRTNTQVGLDYRFKDDSELPDYVKDLDDFMINHYFPVLNIPEAISYLDAIKFNYKVNWIFIAISILHLLGWLTILFFGIYV